MPVKSNDSRPRPLWTFSGAEPDTTDVVDKAIWDVAPSVEFFTWIAGEATSLKPVHRYFLRELEMPRELVHIDGYWKWGVSNLDHHATDDD